MGIFSWIILGLIDSMLVAVAGSVVVLLLYNLLTGRRSV